MAPMSSPGVESLSIISLAPVSVALSRLAGSRLALRISTAASGLEPRRSEIRSAPLPSGRPRSRTATSKLTSAACSPGLGEGSRLRSEEHTSELQSRQYLVCRLLLEKKHTTVAQAVSCL